MNVSVPLFRVEVQADHKSHWCPAGNDLNKNNIEAFIEDGIDCSLNQINVHWPFQAPKWIHGHNNLCVHHWTLLQKSLAPPFKNAYKHLIIWLVYSLAVPDMMWLK